MISAVSETSESDSMELSSREGAGVTHSGMGSLSSARSWSKYIHTIHGIKYKWNHYR